ncbi:MULTISPECIES: serine acetyltransferase [Pseudomonas]|uniref:serine acetyltransferase n=1 Tax=Pseudomonas TaxID=286 RepID=UPI000F95C674|nr:serine acetyltransferase [Pseudomonas sp. Marseille-Q5299]MBG6125889.1 serine acetyltransferase [Pseudomonas sp. M2]NSX20891.1 serine acetyltransferase [Pseudomonas putida]HDS1747115.1 serine acetyltransferase [Pseudomonas putida]
MNFETLLECWRQEVSNKKKPGRRTSLFFNVLRRARKDNKLRFLFAYRLAQYLDARGGLSRRYARSMQQRLNLKYAVDIDIGAQIAPGLRIAHLPGVVITRHASIGRNFFIRQNCSVGIKTLGLDHYSLCIGENVSLGANSCIVADHISIGNNVVIGAMSLVTRDIPPDSTFYNPRQRNLQPRQDS